MPFFDLLDEVIDWSVKHAITNASGTAVRYKKGYMFERVFVHWDDGQEGWHVVWMINVLGMNRRGYESSRLTRMI